MDRRDGISDNVIYLGDLTNEVVRRVYMRRAATRAFVTAGQKKSAPRQIEINERMPGDPSMPRRR